MLNNIEVRVYVQLRFKQKAKQSVCRLKIEVEDVSFKSYAGTKDTQNNQIYSISLMSVTPTK